jgi:7-keto-8-aminopelargonate synthetase-like enzyme
VIEFGADAAPVETLSGSLRDYRNPQGVELLGRLEGFYQWQNLRRQHGYWPYAKSTEEAPLPVCAARDDAGNRFHGVNFASQDYLSLGSHPDIKAAAKAAVDEYGVHSAGSAALFGNTRYSLQLQQQVADFLGCQQTVLYPTGWAAGYGAIRGLVRADDHVVIDALAHNCLQDGAAAATRNVHLFSHLNLQSVRRHLNRIRSRDKTNAILVVTESLFSIEADTPDLAAMQELCREHKATLMIDVAQDLGNIGADGTGHLGLQQMLGKVDVVMGSFAKTFASNGGFVACNAPAVREYLRYFGSTGTFSNALSPVQAAVVSQALAIVRSEEGRQRRAELMARILQLRAGLEAIGIEVVGNPSAIVCAKLGDEALARMVCRRLPRLGVGANLVEFPLVAKGGACLLLQVMSGHSADNVSELVNRLRLALDAAQGSYRRYRVLMSVRETALRTAIGE